MSSVKNLNRAKFAKKDEFYTQLSDVEKEMRHYKSHFKGQTVYCNCDDPRASAFFRYFSLQFHHLGLKRLITSCYRNTSRDLFSKGNSDKAIWLSYDGDKDGDRIPSPDEIGVHAFAGDGDFRSSESVKLLDEADIVVSNPPFSLFREYISQLISHDKKFLVVGNFNAVTHKNEWQYIKDGKMWMGVSPRSMKFETPADGLREVNACWYTNLPHAKRSKEMILHCRYEGNEDAYPLYDNIDAIEVSKTKNIPLDYEGTMGVPITFLEHYCPRQFEIMNVAASGLMRPQLDGKTKYARILIRHKKRVS